MKKIILLILGLCSIAGIAWAGMDLGLGLYLGASPTQSSSGDSILWDGTDVILWDGTDKILWE